MAVTLAASRGMCVPRCPEVRRSIRLAAALATVAAFGRASSNGLLRADSPPEPPPDRSPAPGYLERLRRAADPGRVDRPTSGSPPAPGDAPTTDAQAPGGEPAAPTAAAPAAPTAATPAVPVPIAPAPTGAPPGATPPTAPRRSGPPPSAPPPSVVVVHRRPDGSPTAPTAKGRKAARLGLDPLEEAGPPRALRTAVDRLLDGLVDRRDKDGE